MLILIADLLLNACLNNYFIVYTIFYQCAFPLQGWCNQNGIGTAD